MRYLTKESELMRKREKKEEMRSQTCVDVFITMPIKPSKRRKNRGLEKKQGKDIILLMMAFHGFHPNIMEKQRENKKKWRRFKVR